MPTDRERAMEEARRFLALQVEQDRDCVDELIALILEAEARGVEWTAQQATGYTSHLFQEAIKNRAAELRGQKVTP